MWKVQRKKIQELKWNIKIKLTVRDFPLSHSELVRLMVSRQIFVAVFDTQPVPNFSSH